MIIIYLKSLKMNYIQTFKKSKNVFSCFLILLTLNNERCIDCKIVNLKSYYYEFVIYQENVHPLSFNVIGNKINFSDISKRNLESFTNDLFKENIFTPTLFYSRNYYLRMCSVNYINEEEDLIFTSRFNNLFYDLSSKDIVQFNLLTGQTITVKGVFFEGKVLDFNRENLNFEYISIYPEEIYECDLIKNYYLPFSIIAIKNTE